MIPANTVIFAAPSDDDMIAEARAYIARHRLTADDVKMAKTRDGFVVVTSKREVTLHE